MIHGLIRLLRAADADERGADADLLTAFAEDRDPAAFAALVRRHGPMVFGTCRRILRHEQDAEDAFQATFLVLARRAADVWPRAAVGPWLHGVACRVAGKLRALRATRQGREGVLTGDVVTPTGPLPDPDLGELIDHAVRCLPAIYRAAVVACDLEGLSRTDAAARLGWKEGTLSGRLARGRRLLADRLRRQGVTLPAAGLAAMVGAGGPLEAVPVRLVERTVQMSGWQAAAVPPAVAALTKGVVRTMIATKVRFVAATAVAIGVTGFGAWSAAVGGGQEGKPGSAVPAASKKAEGAPAPAATAEKATVDAIEKELKALAGEWRPTGTINGAGLEEVEHSNYETFLSVAGREMSFNQGLPINDWKLRIERIDANKLPKEIDLLSRNGPGQTRDKIIPCIYELKDDVFYLCMPFKADGLRPVKFLSVMDIGTHAWVFRRKDSVAEQMSSLQGIWTMKRAVVEGKEINKDEMKAARWVIQHDDLWFINGSEMGADMKMKIRVSAAKPWTEIDLTIVGGSPQKVNWDELPGICERNGDELTVCLQTDMHINGKQRPAEFKERQGRMLFVLKKEVFIETRRPPPKDLSMPVSPKP